MIATQVPDFLKELTSLFTIMINGGAPVELAPYISSAPLVPILKKDGKIRPIAIGEILRRICSKLAVRSVVNEVSEYLSPLQVGVGVSNGIESILHGLNTLIEEPSFPVSGIIGAVDFENAFNQVNRQVIFDEVHLRFPKISAWVEYCYGSAAVLFTGAHTIYASTGVQQGDPLGPLLFSLAMQPLLLELPSVNDFCVECSSSKSGCIAKENKSGPRGSPCWTPVDA